MVKFDRKFIQSLANFLFSYDFVMKENSVTRLNFMVDLVSYLNFYFDIFQLFIFYVGQHFTNQRSFHRNIG